MTTPAPTCIESLEARIAPAFLTNINLSSLDGHNGFKISGLGANDASGNSVNDAGDVNGDGFADIIVGGHYADTRHPDSGECYVVFGKAGGFDPNLDLSTLNGANGFKISGAAKNDIFGASVSGAGDVNGDGFADLIVGAPLADPNGDYSGASYVIFGHGGAFGANLNLSVLNGSNGFKIIGAAASDHSGNSVSGAGDVNGDGFADLIVGAKNAAPNGTASGAAYVIFGRAGGFTAQFDLSTLDGTNGFKVSGTAANDSAGYSVSGAGDVNGDGFADLIVGAPFSGANGPASGASYVVFGQASGFAADLSLSALDGANGFKIGGVAGRLTGISVSGAGDVNGDGFADLIVGADYGGALSNQPATSFVVFGHGGAFATSLNLSTLDGTNGFAIGGGAQKLAGFSVSGAGDVNGDGFADLIVGAFQASPHGNFSGASFVVFGKATGFGAAFDLSTINGANGFKLNGAQAYDASGFTVSGAGDINGDGFADLIVGAPNADPHGVSSGASYVVFGFPTFGISKNGRTAIFPDSDGDILTIKTSQGHFHLSEFTLDPNGGLVSLDLRGHAAEFAGANLTFTAGTPVGGGDGLLDVGQILADGVDLGRVKIDGHLGLLHAGDADIRTPGVQALIVDGLGGPGGLHSAITGALGMLVVKGDIAGADVSILGGTKARLGVLDVTGDIAGGSDFHISGNLGTAHIGGNLDGSGFRGIGFHVGGRIGSFTVDGDVQGNSPALPFIISALGKLGTTQSSQAAAIGTLRIGGNVANAQVLAGYTLGGDPLNGDAGIGKVVIEGDFAASAIVAGIADATHDGFGQNDSVIPGGKAALVATIANLTIKGTATGSAASGDFFGITAGSILEASIHGIALALTANADSLLLDATNNDLRLVDFE